MRAVALLAFAALFSGIGRTCCLAYGEDAKVTLSGETAVIIWDAEAHREHFIREASFTADAEDFGFIVPTPGKPEVAEADEKAFSLLESLVPVSRNSDGITKGIPAGAAPSAELIEQYQVGDYEVSVLKADEGAAMLDWLEENEYVNRPAMEPWLDYYAKMGWHFAALKFIRPVDSDRPETKAVRVSFDTNEPFYPYKMPTDTWPSGHFRPLSLYFVSYGMARASYRGLNKDWEANIRWSGPLPRESAQGLADAVGLEVVSIPPDATVTVFRNTENAQGYDRDLKFDTYTTLIPTWGLGLIALGVVGGFVYVFKTRKTAT